jgi:hypothetical protein
MFGAYVSAVERLKEYSEVESEAPAVIPDHRPPAQWPTAGAIEIR